jgi:hypothetical protein
MSNEAIFRIRKQQIRYVIGNSQFRDDIWVLSPLITQMSQSQSRKKLKFHNIHSLSKIYCEQFM